MLLVGSREYKLPLKTGLDPVEVWAGVASAAEGLGLSTWGALSVETQRTLERYDTRAFALRGEGLSLRRIWAEGREELCLRFRSEDRYIAGQVPVWPSRGFAFRSSFIEEIWPPFLTRYAYSTAVELGENRNGVLLERAGLTRVFPLARRVAAGEELAPVTSRKTVERVFTGAHVELPHPRQSAVTASVALILSHRSGGAPRAELSLRFGERNERFDIEVCRAARRLYEALQASFPERPREARGAG